MADFHHEFERDMRDSLRPREAPGGFADRMMRRIPASGLRPILQWPVWRWSAAAAVLLAVLLGDLTYQHQQHIAGERARRQVLLAFGTVLDDGEDAAGPRAIAAAGPARAAASAKRA